MNNFFIYLIPYLYHFSSKRKWALHYPNFPVNSVKAACVSCKRYFRQIIRCRIEAIQTDPASGSHKYASAPSCTHTYVHVLTCSSLFTRLGKARKARWNLKEGNGEGRNEENCSKEERLTLVDSTSRVTFIFMPAHLRPLMVEHVLPGSIERGLCRLHNP